MNQQFFENIFPSQGNVCIAGIDQNGTTIPRFANNLEDAMALVQSFASRNINVYFTPGTYQGSRRRKEECLFVKSFFLDLDVAHGKNQYESKEAAVLDVERFCNEVNWPKPVLIDSGGGIHAYWILKEELPAADWKGYAEQFKALCLERGMLIDEVVSADAARLMRVPGTNNYRYDPPSPSVLLTEVETHDFSVLRPALGEVEKPFKLSDVDKGLDPDTKAIFEKRRNNFEYDFSQIVVTSLQGTGCAQIKYIVENAASCPEPLWYAGLSVAVRCRDGGTAIHRMSEGHPDYTSADTERKAQQSLREANWAHGCEAFERENRDGCAGCPHRGRITGPIELGKVLKVAHVSVDAGEQPVVEQPDGIIGDESEDETQSIRYEADTQKILVFPDFLLPFARGASGGIYYTPPPKTDKKGRVVPSEPELLTPNDVYPVKRVYSPHDGECLVMRVYFPMDKTREFFLPMKDVAAIDKLKIALASNGVVFEPAIAPRLASYLMKWTNYLMETGTADTMRVQQGWTEDQKSFVIGTTEYFPDGTEKHCPPSPLSKGVVRHIRQRGDFETWKKSAQMFNDPGYELHAFAFLCGLASPLMEVTNVNGVILSLYSEGPGTGKTGALNAALSVWGDPEALGVYEGTANGLMQRMITSKNIMFGLDEQGNLDGKIVSPLAYGISSGKSKIRLMASTNQEREASYNSRLIAVITTNKAMKSILAEYKANNAAENVRILEPEVHKPNVPGYELSAERGVEMFEPLKYNFGHAGPIFIKGLFDIGMDELRRSAKAQYLYFTEKFSKNSEFRFVTNLFVTVRMAGDIGNQLGFFKFDMDRIIGKVGEIFQQDIIDKKHDDASGRDDVIGDFVNKNISNCLVINQGKVTLTPRGSLYVRAEVDTGHIYISTSALKGYLRDIKMDARQLENRLTKSGVLKGKVRKQMATGWADALGATNVNAYELVMDMAHLFKTDEQSVGTGA